jgi:FMN reductase
MAVETALPIHGGDRPYVVGLGGTTREGSSSERALAFALREAERHGARTMMFGASELDLPMYSPDAAQRCDLAVRLVREVGVADALIVCTPGYHGGVSGLVKNALDYLEDLRDTPSPYLEGKAVGCISCAAGWQAAVGTLSALRAIVHALRGWPTPFGAALNSSVPLFDGVRIIDSSAATALSVVGRQVAEWTPVRV